jgi:diphthine-ammonia ligase
VPCSPSGTAPGPSAPLPRRRSSPAPRGPLAAVLWTGGKDCALALHESVERGLDVRLLATFVPTTGEFCAHPIALARLQAKAMGIEYRTLPVDRPYRCGYERQILRLREEGFETLVTGDIGRVGGRANWIRERARPAGLRVATPLWGRDRADVLSSLARRRISAIVSYVREPGLPPEWLGRRLDPAACDALVARGGAREFDACGEQGEYHSIVLDAPMFSRRVDVRCGPVVVHPGARHLSFARAKLVAKRGRRRRAVGRSQPTSIARNASAGPAHSNASGWMRCANSSTPSSVRGPGRET